MMEMALLSGCLVVGLFVPANAVDWRLQRATMSGSCVIGPVPPVPKLGAVLATKPTRKAICEFAKFVEDGGAEETTKCFTFTVFTVSECKKEGIQMKP